MFLPGLQHRGLNKFHPQQQSQAPPLISEFLFLIDQENAVISFCNKAPIEAIRRSARSVRHASY
jgi:hypothetical protein